MCLSIGFRFGFAFAFAFDAAAVGAVYCDWSVIQIYDKNRIEKCTRLHFSIPVALKCSIFHIIVLDVACSLVAPRYCPFVIVTVVVTRVRMQYEKVTERENSNRKSTQIVQHSTYVCLLCLHIHISARKKAANRSVRKLHVRIPSNRSVIERVM